MSSVSRSPVGGVSVVAFCVSLGSPRTVALNSVKVRYLDEVGGEAATTMAGVDARHVAAGRPVRRVRHHQGGRSCAEMFWSATNGSQVGSPCIYLIPWRSSTSSRLTRPGPGRSRHGGRHPERPCGDRPRREGVCRHRGTPCRPRGRTQRMSLAFEFHPDANAEADADVGWYEDREPGLGRHVAEAVREAVDAATDSPETWATWPGWDLEPPVRFKGSTAS